ncbi:unnamed protein product, partial [Ectocarpus sp. 12 AP-2014]
DHRQSTVNSHTKRHAREYSQQTRDPARKLNFMKKESVLTTLSHHFMSSTIRPEVDNVEVQVFEQGFFTMRLALPSANGERKRMMSGFPYSVMMVEAWRRGRHDLACSMSFNTFWMPVYILAPSSSKISLINVRRLAARQ